MENRRDDLLIRLIYLRFLLRGLVKWQRLWQLNFVGLLGSWTYENRRERLFEHLQ